MIHSSANRLPDTCRKVTKSMAQPWQIIESVSTEDGLLELRKRGARDFLITVDGQVLMNSTANRSEVALGQLACGHLKTSIQPRVLVGGLGMGFTLKAVLDTLPVTGRVVVAELNPVVLDWCRGPLAALTNNVTADARVTVDIGDVAQLIQRYAQDDRLEKFDAVILDLYTGPYVRSHKRDDPLFGTIAINKTRSALKPDGVFAVWGEDYDAGFARRLEAAGFVSTRHRSGRGGSGHVVYLGLKAGGAKAAAYR
jgi:spermidine synthase